MKYKLKLFDIFTLTMLIWYSVARWYFYSYFNYDNDIKDILNDPYCNFTAVICSIYLFMILFMSVINIYLTKEYMSSIISKIMFYAYISSTIYLFLYHAYSCGWFFEDFMDGSKVVNFIEIFLNPIPLIYFIIRIKNLFSCLKKH